jgi:hypothetical protein
VRRTSSQQQVESLGFAGALFSLGAPGVAARPFAPKAAADREAWFNAMLNDVSGGKAKDLLTTHGCAPF